MKRRLAAALVALLTVAGLTLAIQAPAQANTLDIPSCNSYPNPPSQARWNQIAWHSASWGRGKICRLSTGYNTDEFYINVDDTLTDGRCVNARALYLGYALWLPVSSGSCGPETVNYFYTEPGFSVPGGPYGLALVQLLRMAPGGGYPEVSIDLYNDPNGG